MKKNIFRIALATVLATAFFSCDEPEDVLLVGTEAKEGSGVGTIIVPANSQFLYQETSEVAINVDVVGDLTEFYVYQQLRTSQGNSDVELVYTGTSSGAVTISEAELFANTPVNGEVLSEDLLGAGDSFRFTFAIKNTAGETVQLSTKTVTVTFSCPLSATSFVGTYLYEPIVTGPYGAVFGAAKEIEISATTPTLRAFSAVYLQDLGIGNGPIDLNFELICGKVYFGTISQTGLGCGSGQIGLGPATTPSEFDPSDDTTFDVALTEFTTDGGCGEAPTQILIRFTKVQ